MGHVPVDSSSMQPAFLQAFVHVSHQFSNSKQSKVIKPAMLCIYLQGTQDFYINQTDQMSFES